MFYYKPYKNPDVVKLVLCFLLVTIKSYHLVVLLRQHTVCNDGESLIHLQPTPEIDLKRYATELLNLKKA